MRKKIIIGIAFLSLILAISSCGQGSWDEVRVAVEGAYPPFSQTESDGSVTGFDIDIANTLCDEMESECELITQEWDGMIPGLLAKKYDAIIASMSITEERKEKVDFTQCYYTSPAQFAARRDRNIQIVASVEANKKTLKGLSIGVQQSTVSDNYVTDNYGDVATIRRYGKQEEANLDIINGRLDLLFADSVALDSGFLSTDQGSDYEFKGPGFSDEQWFGEGIGIAIRKEDIDLKEKLNKALNSIYDSGEYSEIVDSYFNFDISCK